MLRLEQLYLRLNFFIAREHPFEHHSALLVLFEIMEVASRAELKSDLLQELERQKQTLEGLHSNPAIDVVALDAALEHIDQVAGRLLKLTSKFGQHLRENEWLMAIKQRAVIPGGTCSFDLPSYALWQSKSAAERQADIQRWAEPLMPTSDAADILLRLLRDSGKTHQYQARRGTFQQMSGGRVVQLIRVDYPEGLEALPELSANKYAINLRFIHASTGEARARQSEQDIDFAMTFCKF
ncbi:cell division protein ZapD [Craterilacuibacter sp.]|uniref:cell division protein ZapD n=1 Tax=Craterilacuibacter sp. TaxID=2870909 RepID=UPI003F2E740E